MSTTRTFALAAVIAMGTAAPAFADWDRLGAVTVTGRETTRAYTSFGGPVEKLYLNADRNVYCRSVNVRFSNGRVRNVFSGTLRQGAGRVIDLPGNQRTVQRIDFRCRALARRSAQIMVSAEIGSYRETWRRHPNFLRQWAKQFNWGDDRDDRREDRADRREDREDRRDDRNDRRDNDQWVRLGAERFDGRESESTFAGFRGQGLTAIALQATDDDARCTTVRVTFANGQSRSVNFGERMTEDRMYRIDLPGDERNVTRVDLTCRPIGDNDVTVIIYGLT
jgi:hypothetical protein